MEDPAGGEGRREGPGSYPVPAGIHRAEEEVRRSRFLATLAPAPDPVAAHALIASVRDAFPDATHHCWGFVAGPPGSTARIGMSDAGEPHGTAGRPILNALLHSGVGEVVAVVTRWYGGVQLGRGGLGRAYAGAVTGALATLPTRERVEEVAVRIRVGFRSADALFRHLDGLPPSTRSDRYLEDGTLEVTARVPRQVLPELRRVVAEFTAGEGRLELGEE